MIILKNTIPVINVNTVSKPIDWRNIFPGCNKTPIFSFQLRTFPWLIGRWWGRKSFQFRRENPIKILAQPFFLNFFFYPLLSFFLPPLFISSQPRSKPYLRVLYKAHISLVGSMKKNNYETMEFVCQARVVLNEEEIAYCNGCSTLASLGLVYWNH